MNERLELHFRAVAQHLLSAGLSSSSSSSANLNSKGHGGRRGGNKSGSGSGGYGYEGVAEPVCKRKKEKLSHLRLSNL